MHLSHVAVPPTQRPRGSHVNASTAVPWNPTWQPIVHLDPGVPEPWRGGEHLTRNGWNL